jgi:hypothetical protein
LLYGGIVIGNWSTESQVASRYEALDSAKLDAAPCVIAVANANERRPGKDDDDSRVRGRRFAQVDISNCECAPCSGGALVLSLQQSGDGEQRREQKKCTAAH